MRRFFVSTTLLIAATLPASANTVLLRCGDVTYRVNYDRGNVAARNPDTTWTIDFPAQISSEAISWTVTPCCGHPKIYYTIDRLTGGMNWHDTTGDGGSSVCKPEGNGPKF